MAFQYETPVVTAFQQQVCLFSTTLSPHELAHPENQVNSAPKDVLWLEV